MLDIFLCQPRSLPLFFLRKPFRKTNDLTSPKSPKNPFFAVEIPPRPRHNPTKSVQLDGFAKAVAAPKLHARPVCVCVCVFFLGGGFVGFPQNQV